jgi:gliding motility-associated lipoprotein GldH
MPKSNYFLPAAIVLIMGAISCGRNVVYTDSATMPSKTWQIENVPSFQIPVDDTVSSNNIIFSVRTGSSYPYRNIYLFATTTSPDGKSITDTLQYNLADEKGNWYGKGFGDIHELMLPFKTNVYFPRKGSYQIRVQHGMRVRNLKGVYDFGIRIEKAGKPGS